MLRDGSHSHKFMRPLQHIATTADFSDAQGGLAMIGRASWQSCVPYEHFARGRGNIYESRQPRQRTELHRISQLIASRYGRYVQTTQTSESEKPRFSNNTQIPESGRDASNVRDRALTGFTSLATALAFKQCRHCPS